MKKILTSIVCSILLVILSGCATPGPLGLIVTDFKSNIGVNDGRTDIKSAPKKGSAECYSVVGLVAWGDNTIRTAAKDGEITKVWYTEYSVVNWFGFYAKYKVTVYGE